MFVIIAPTCWFGSPHDFWWLAPTALTATATACVAIMVRLATPIGRTSWFWTVQLLTAAALKSQILVTLPYDT